MSRGFVGRGHNVVNVFAASKRDAVVKVTVCIAVLRQK